MYFVSLIIIMFLVLFQNLRALKTTAYFSYLEMSGCTSEVIDIGRHYPSRWICPPAIATIIKARRNFAAGPAPA